MKYLLFVISIFTFIACGGGGGDTTPPPSIPPSPPPATLSSGLKIFVTANGHVGDFANDPLLTGNNAIEKADSFCNLDPNKPNASVYKALIVDGAIRDALSLTNWVLEPDTTYFRPYGDIEIGTTINTAIFPVLYADLINSIDDQRQESNDGFRLPNNTYTGISNASNYSSSGVNTCGNWSIGTNQASANWGIIYAKTENSVSTNGLIGCSYRASLYCVEQP